MNDIREIDFGIGPLVDVETTINSGIEKLFERNVQTSWFDGLWMNEYGEVLHGSLLVAGQAYSIRCLSDINVLRVEEGLNELKKIEAYKQYSISKNGYSLIELLNAVANCFKHRDEWGESWPLNLTTKTLKAYGITQLTEFPINEAVDIILIEYKNESISDLLSNWRSELIEQICEEE